MAMNLLVEPKDKMRPLSWDDLGQISPECFGIDTEAPEHDAAPNFHDPMGGKRDYVQIEDFTEDDLDREHGFILDRKGLQSCIVAGERLAEMLDFRLGEPGVSVVIAAYLDDQMDGVIREFCRGTETVRKASCDFVEKLQKVLSQQEGRECWPAVSNKSGDKLSRWLRFHGRTLAAQRFAELILGPSVASRILAAA